MAKVLEQPKYKCACCETEYLQLKPHFYPSASTINKGTGYLPVCKTCVQKTYTALRKTERYDNDYKAIYRMCMMFDIYFSEKVFKASENRNADANRFGIYMTKNNQKQYQTVGKTFEDTLREEADRNIIEASQHLYNTKVIDENGDMDITPLRKKWGGDYEPDELLALEDLFGELAKDADVSDTITYFLIKDLCDIKIQEGRCRKKNDIKGMMDFKKLFQSTLDTANMKPKETKYNDENDSFINSLALIEKYAPPQVVGHLDLFKDVDNFEEDYLSRFIERPHHNLENDTNIMDEEYSV